jgi:hypothetical protein
MHITTNLLGAFAIMLLWMLAPLPHKALLRFHQCLIMIFVWIGYTAV